MNNRIGIMQGRLSKSENGKIQSFPVSNWEREFELAAEIGYSSIEWVIESDGIDKNPLFSTKKHKIINKLVENNNISIPAVCHDMLMDLPLHSSDRNISEAALIILTKTIEACDSLGIKFIEIQVLKDYKKCKRYWFIKWN